MCTAFSLLQVVWLGQAVHAGGSGSGHLLGTQGLLCWTKEGVSQSTDAHNLFSSVHVCVCACWYFRESLIRQAFPGAVHCSLRDYLCPTTWSERETLLRHSGILVSFPDK